MAEFDKLHKTLKAPVLPQEVAPPPIAVSDMIPVLPEPDYDALKKFSRGSMSIETVATIQKTYARGEPRPGGGSPQVKPPTTGLRAGWKGGR